MSLSPGSRMSWLVSQVRPTFHDGRSLREIAQRPLLGMVSALPTHGLRVMRRRAALLFAGGQRPVGVLRRCFRVPFPGRAWLLRTDPWISSRKPRNDLPNYRRPG